MTATTPPGFWCTRSAGPGAPTFRPTGPSRATTPPNPITSPTTRSPVGRSAGEKRTDSSATISGMEAIRMAASDEEMCCSPAAISRNGTATSQAV